MTNQKRTPISPRLAFPREVFSAQVALNALLLIAVSLFTSAAPGFALRELTESEAPFEQEPVEQELSGKESVISQQTRARMRHTLPKMSLLGPIERHARYFGRVAHGPHAGHRLSNNLLAPLRC